MSAVGSGGGGVNYARLVGVRWEGDAAATTTNRLRYFMPAIVAGVLH